MKTFLKMTMAAALLAGVPSVGSAAVKGRHSAKVAVEKPDRSAVIYKKCVEIEKLSKKKSALKCLDRFLDRMDVEVNEIETRIMGCGERRRLENFDDGEHIRQVVSGEMRKLRNVQAESVDQNVREEEGTSGRLGPRKLKEIELRAAEQHAKRAAKLSKLVCNREAFASFLKHH